MICPSIHSAGLVSTPGNGVNPATGVVDGAVRRNVLRTRFWPCPAYVEPAVHDSAQPSANDLELPILGYQSGVTDPGLPIRGYRSESRYLVFQCLEQAHRKRNLAELTKPPVPPSGRTSALCRLQHVPRRQRHTNSAPIERTGRARPEHCVPTGIPRQYRRSIGYSSYPRRALCDLRATTPTMCSQSATSAPSRAGTAAHGTASPPAPRRSSTESAARRSNDIVVVGLSGTTAHFDGWRWSRRATGTTADMPGVAPLDGTRYEWLATAPPTRWETAARYANACRDPPN